jgi:hypothetical protein
LIGAVLCALFFPTPDRRKWIVIGLWIFIYLIYYQIRH